MSPYFVLAIAIIPAVALMIFIYLQDSHEKEPLGLLLGIFGLGILSAIPAIILEKIAEIIIDLIFGGMPMLRLAISAFFGVAIIEEGVKFIAAYLPTWRNRHFNYKFDGIVYCIAGSMGFAAIENVLYLVQQYYLDNTQIISMGVQRGLLAIPAHGMCAIFMGYYYGNAKYAKSYGDRAGCRGFLIKGYLIACSLHAFYDFCLFTGNPILYLLFLVFVVVADVFTIIRIVKAKKENQKMYEAPQYRNYWVDNLSNPYQEYGGYQAPTYGNYIYQNNNNNVNPNYQAPYQQQRIVPNSFRNQMIRCPICGQTNNFNAFFCTSCGGSLHGNRM
ncbi:MAG: PrsW family intramembrane metalloprotease [Eubacterium sp.]|nr:PrsW family intramembrane metalloprotease [Eubacterium sp.]